MKTPILLLQTNELTNTEVKDLIMYLYTVNKNIDCPLTPHDIEMRFKTGKYNLCFFLEDIPTNRNLDLWSSNDIAAFMKEGNYIITCSDKYEFFERTIKEDFNK